MGAVKDIPRSSKNDWTTVRTGIIEPRAKTSEIPSLG